MRAPSVYSCGGAEERKGFGSDTAATFAHAVAPVGAPSEAAAGLDGERRGKVSANLTSKAHRRVVYLATVQMRASSDPKHTRTEGRAPVWGSEFTTKGRYRDAPRCEAP